MESACSHFSDAKGMYCNEYERAYLHSLNNRHGWSRVRDMTAAGLVLLHRRATLVGLGRGRLIPSSFGLGKILRRAGGRDAKTYLKATSCSRRQRGAGDDQVRDMKPGIEGKQVEYREGGRLSLA